MTVSGARLPSGWSVTRFGREAIVNTGLVDPEMKPWSDMPLVAPNHVEGHTGRLLPQDSAAEQSAESGKCLVRKGQVIYSKIRPSLNKVTIAEEDCLCSADMYAISSRGRLDHRFLVYSMLGKPFHSYVTQVSDRVKMPKVNRQELAGAPLLLPPIEEQVAIADFLDRETAKIDALIDKQRALIRGLNERRAAVLNQVLRRSSGVTGVPLREVAKIQTGLTLGGANQVDDGREFPYLRVANVQVGRVEIEDVATVVVTSEVARTSMLRRGDVLMTEGGDRAALGRGSIWHAPIDPCLHQNHVFAVRARLDRLVPEFLVYVLEGEGARRYFESTRRQTTNLSSTNSRLVRAFRFTLPTLSEQRQLVRDLDKGMALIANANETLERSINLAQERRSALIAAAVTGQLDIGGAA